ncbi:hypothetical protein [Ottowia testudinis]|uniref:Uncharacterized protein n=1 Tax=Ottowia testudinis TaxID=2816950 RepID=A0A975CGY5_9BURK|nr:hypothetical protein [Ottowia testudinis]QTD45606.1 hypothetical protein J1M35_01390 [Ottowia testudinis]
MKSTVLLASIAVLAASFSAPLLAQGRDHGQDRGHDRRHAAPLSTASGAARSMQAVDNAAQPGQRAHGWRYFSDPAWQHAVVISPQGDYYFSRGDGLRWVAGTPTDV